MATKKQPDEAKGGGTVKARVLIDCEYGRCNDVVEVPVGTESAALDMHPDAVAYAETLRAAAG